MYNRFRSKLLISSIVGVTSFAMLPSGWTQNLDPFGPPEPTYPEVMEPTDKPNVEGVADSILLEEVPKAETVQEPEIVKPVEMVKSAKNRVTTQVPVPSQTAGKNRLPVDILRAHRAPRVAQLVIPPKSQESNTEKISASRQLLEKLSPVSDSYLEGVESIDLRTFLNSPRLQQSTEAVQEALPTYWEACVLRSAVCYWEQRADALKKLSETASATDKPLYEAGIAAAQSNLGAAKIALRMNAVELGNLAGYTREVTAKTQPHAGNYETRYEDIRATQGELSGRVTYLNGILTIHQEQVTAATTAYSTSENLLNLQVSQGAGAVAILAAWDMLNERREAFFDALLEFNRDILNYVLQVSTRRGPELAPLLVRPITDVSLKANPTRKAPSLPTAPREIPSENGNLPSVVESSGTETSPQPTFVDTPASTGNSSSETIPAYEGNGTVDLNPLPINTGISEEMPTIETLVPGGDLSAPTTESPVPGSEFIPIGGETGVDVNPILDTPSASSEKNSIDALLENRIETDVAVRQITVRYPNVNKNISSQNAIQATHSVLTSSVVPERSQVTLEEVLSRTFPQNRERAVHTYWRYATFQKQMCVLEYQQEILNTISKRVLTDSLNSTLSPMLGMSLELQFLILRTELLKIQAQSWKEWCRLEGYLSEEPTWPVHFPVAETEMKSEAFQIGLDRYAPGSEQDLKTLPLARHLYFCASQLPTTFESVMSLSEQIAPPSGTEDYHKSTFFQHLKTCPYSELSAFFGTLACAREASFRYFQLLYSMNSTYSSCVLVGEHSSDSATELAQILSQ